MSTHLPSGVDNFDQTELDCILDQNDVNVDNICYTDDFKELDILIQEVKHYT